MLKNTSLIVRFSLLFVLALALIGVAYYLVLRQVYYSELQRQARSIADNVDAFGKWVSQYGRVWIRDPKTESRFLSQVSFHETPAGGEAKEVNFFSKNPALAQREFSEVVAKSPAKAKFRMTSDNWMNPANTPDEFEAGAIKKIKSAKIDEYIEIRGENYRYARKIIHAESCIGCHGSAEAAPKDVVDRYGSERGYGFKAGDVAGVISVTLPTEPLLAASLRVLGPIEIALIVIAFVILYLFVHFGVVKPIKKLTKNAEAISVGKAVDLDASKLAQTSRNELSQLTLAISRLRTSMELAINRMKGGS
jgi:methyl-accepting chemotaxis protein